MTQIFLRAGLNPANNVQLLDARAVQLSGTARGLSSASGAMRITIGGAVAGHSVASGAMRVNLAGTAAAHSSASGAMRVNIAGHASGTSAAHGSLVELLAGGDVTQIFLRAGLNPANNVQLLDARAVQLSGTARGLSSASGAMRITIGGAVAGHSVASGAMRVNLAGTAAAHSSASGAMRVNIAGHASGTSAAHGSLVELLAGGDVTQIFLRAGLNPANNVQLLDARAVQLSGTARGLSSASGAMRITIGGAVAGHSVASGAMRVNLAGTAAAHSSASGAMRVNIAGHASGTSAAHGSLVELRLGGTALGDSSASGKLTQQGGPVAKGVAFDTGVWVYNPPAFSTPPKTEIRVKLTAGPPAPQAPKPALLYASARGRSSARGSLRVRWPRARAIAHAWTGARKMRMLASGVTKGVAAAHVRGGSVTVLGFERPEVDELELVSVAAAEFFFSEPW